MAEVTRYLTVTPREDEAPQGWTRTHTGEICGLEGLQQETLIMQIYTAENRHMECLASKEHTLFFSYLPISNEHCSHFA